MPGAADLGGIPGAADLGVMPGAADLGVMPGAADLGGIPGAALALGLLNGKVNTSLDKAGEGQLCTDLQLGGAVFLVIIRLGIGQGFNLCKIVEFAVSVHQIIMIKNVKRIRAEVHPPATDHRFRFFKGGVFGILLATADQAGFKCFVTFHSASLSSDVVAFRTDIQSHLRSCP